MNRDLLSEAERRRMLADIAVVALAIGRDLFPERGLDDLDIGDGTGISDGGGILPCPRERLAFLSAWWPRIEAALRALEAAPAPALRQETRLVPIDRARRVSPRAMLEAVRAGDFVAAPVTPSLLAGKLGGRLPRRIRETVAAPTGDTPANRAVKTMLAQWARDLAAIAELAQVVGVTETARTAFRLRLRVRSHLCREPWHDLPPLPLVPPLSPAHRTNAPYRLLSDAFRRYRRAFAFNWDNPLFSLPARETWLLYEYWTLFQTANALRALGYRAVQAEDFPLLRGSLTFTLAKGRASRLVFSDGAGRRAELTYSRSFEAVAKGKQGWRSRSHAMRPDITLEAGGNLLLFDAKFKAYAAAEETGGSAETATGAGPVNLPLTDDINQLHAYRDGIQRQPGAGKAGDGVRGAWLLYTGRAGGTNQEVIAYPGSTVANPYGEGQIGALLLRPGGVGGNHLPEVVRRFLQGEAEVPPSPSLPPSE